MRARVTGGLVAALLAGAAGCAFRARPEDVEGAAALPAPARLTLGKVTTLDDEAFSRDRVHDGLLQPVTAERPVGFGIYFLAPYSAAKTPVLFVHGMAGSPLDFRRAVEALDPARYQAWVMCYPTGMRLAVVAQVLADQLASLHRRLGFSRLLVVAHSMGGLVSRAAVLRLMRAGQAGFVEALVTMSTPYGGQTAAGFGARDAPGVVPAWTDLAPGSEFLRSLEAPLSPALPFFLLFTFGNHGGERHFWDLARWFSLATFSGSNDDAVTLASELAPYVQGDAVRMFGYDVDHSSILVLPEALQRLTDPLGAAPGAAVGAR
ncbi:MAG: esterase/lipase family protein [Myxococcales bacterium]